MLLFIAPDDRLAGWWRIDGGVVEHGAADELLPDDPSARVVAVAPAEAMTIHVAELGGLAMQQARAAARLLVAETSVVPIDTQHVAVGAADGGDRAVAVIGAGRMTAWLEALQARGLDPDIILAAPLLPPRPETGFARMDVGGETVLRGRSAAFAATPDLTDILVGGAEVEDIDAERAILAALDAPELDLRQGAFVKRRGFRVDWPHVRRLALLGGAVAAVTLLITLVQIVRYNTGAGALDAQAQTAARAAAPNAGSDPVAGLQARLTARRGAGLGFTTTAGAVLSAVQSIPNVELSALSFEPDGMLRATILAPGAAEAELLRSRLRSAGLGIEATPFTQEAGRIRGDFRVSPR